MAQPPSRPNSPAPAPPRRAHLHLPRGGAPAPAQRWGLPAAPTRGGGPACPPPAAQTWPRWRGCPPGAPPPAGHNEPAKAGQSAWREPCAANLGHTRSPTAASRPCPCPCPGAPLPQRPIQCPPVCPTCRRSSSGCSPGLWGSREVELRGSSGRRQLFPSLPSMAAAKGAASGTAPAGEDSGREAGWCGDTPRVPGMEPTQQPSLAGSHTRWPAPAPAPHTNPLQLQAWPR